MNIEYNIFEEVAAKLTKEGGDVADAESPHGYSPYPGNINTIIYNLHDYVSVLKSTKGVVPEFINPKYADETKTRFSKPARIESLMQDFAKLLCSDRHNVGGVVFERDTFQPVKNTLQEGLNKIAHGQSGYCAGTGEGDFYELMRQRCANIGVHVTSTSCSKQEQVQQHDNNNNNNNHISKNALPFDNVRLPIIVLDGSAANHYTLHDLQHIFPTPDRVYVSENSTLIIEGNVIVKSLVLDGVLHLCGPDRVLSSEREPHAKDSNFSNDTLSEILVIDNVEVHNEP